MNILPGHKITLRAILFAAAVTLIVYFLPRTDKNHYIYEVGRPWSYALLTAPFDIPVHLDSASVAVLKDSIDRNFEPVYVRDIAAEKTLISDYTTRLNSSSGLNITPAQKNQIIKAIRNVYDDGIVDRDTYQRIASGQLPAVRFVHDNVAISIPTDRYLSAFRAYEHLDSTLRDRDVRAALTATRLSDMLQPTITLDTVTTRRLLDEAYQKAMAPVGVIQQGERIIDKGEVVTLRLATILDTYEEMIEDRGDGKISQHHYPVAGQILYMVILLGALYGYLHYFRPDYFSDNRTVVFLMSLVTVFTLFTFAMQAAFRSGLYISPFTMVPILVLVFLDSRTAYFTHLIQVLICTIVAPFPLEFVFLQFIAGVVAIDSLKDLAQRSQLIRTAAFIFLAYSLCYVSIEIMQAGSLSKAEGRIFGCFGINAILISFSYVLMFLLERVFGYTSRVTLVELSDTNNPLLRELSEECPGTFNHSMAVSNLASTAAQAIGANVQMVRTGALYHDIGKIKNPAFFTENQHGVNPHDSLDPIQSARVVTGHIRDGLAMAEKAKLPPKIREFIAEHHGAGKARYFYNTYCNAHPGEEIDPTPFTYPGPNPRSRETSLLMMADAVEAASRSMKEHSPEAITALVNKIIDGQIAEGLHNESPLSFRDVQAVKESFIQRLRTMYHSRISYPELKNNLTDNPIISPKSSKLLIMPKLLLTSLAIAATALCAKAYDPVTLPVIAPDPAIEQKIAERLATMTLDEKVGQMLQLQIDIIGDHDANGVFHFSQAKADSVIGTYKVGSFLNTPGSTCLTAAEWCQLIPKIQETSIRLTGIPTIYGLDQNHGTTYTADGTLFPQNINVAASFNTQLAHQAAQITAYETRASDCPWTFSPTLDLARDPRWPRFWENYGEDPLVNSLMGIAAVTGFQGNDPNHVGPDHIAVSVKHFMGYGVPYSGKDRTPAYISPSDLREKHFAPYLATLKNGALTIMVNSASINGVPVHANPILLSQWIKDDLQWDGMIVTDWADINNLYTREKVAKDKKDAIRMAINAGIDMAMEPYKCDFCTLLKELVQEGKVPMSRIDDAVSRVLRLKYRLGLFDRPDTYLKDYPKFASKSHGEAALAAAEETMVLLKNDNSILPIAQGTKLFITGPTANSMRSLNGGWSYSWQGHIADAYAKDHNTILEAMQQRFGKGNITYIPTVTFNEKGSWQDEQCDTEALDRAVKEAAKADAIILCIGENSYCETPGNLSDLHLSALQRDMVKRFATAGRPIILVLNEGRPRLVADIEPLATAVIDIMLPGNFGGDALARLMAGDVNFSGKLPFTYPREINSLVTYDYKVSEEVGSMEGAYDYDAKVNVQWPFGYGRSYTTYSYSDLKVDKKEFTASDVLTVTLLVTNTGQMQGKESVLLFSSDHVASIVPDNKRLRAFTKIALMPGETREVKFQIPACDLAFVGADGRWTLEEGDFTLTVGQLSLPIHCTATTTFDRPNI